MNSSSGPADAEPSLGEPGEKPDRSLRRLALKSATWSVFGHVANQLMRLGSNVVLARILFPEAFGLMAIVYVFLQGLQMFSDVGIGPSVIQNARGEEEDFLNTAWTVQVLRGGALTVCATILAWPVAAFYKEPTLLQLLPVVGLTAAIHGFESTSLFVQQRKLNLGPVIRVEFYMFLSQVVVMLVWASIWPSVWALVAGGVVGAISKTVLSHLYLPSHRHRFHWDPSARDELFRFGRWIFLSTAFTFLASQGDRLLLGHYLGMATLGVYSMAARLTESLNNVQGRLVHSILFPVLSETVRDQPERLRARYYKARLSLDAVFLPASGFAFFAGRVIIGLLYDDRYAEAGWILELLTLQTAMACVLLPPETLLFSQGRSYYGFARSLSRAVWIAVGIPLGWHFAQLPGLVWVVALSEFPVMVVLWFGLIRHKLIDVPREARAIIFWMLGAGAGWAVERLWG
jgi:O-antigen/teichoic acid export membrane protein